jgi:hypothetical protein
MSVSLLGLVGRGSTVRIKPRWNNARLLSCSCFAFKNSDCTCESDVFAAGMYPTYDASNFLNESEFANRFL